MLSGNWEDDCSCSWYIRLGFQLQEAVYEASLPLAKNALHSPASYIYGKIAPFDSLGWLASARQSSVRPTVVRLRVSKYPKRICTKNGGRLEHFSQ